MKYVDDTTLCVPLFKNGNNDQVSKEHLNVVNWSSLNGFKINTDKCKTTCYSKTKLNQLVQLNNVKKVKEMKFLGVMINCKLTWHSHFKVLCSLASKRIFALRVLKPLLSKSNLVLVYNATIRSLLEYSSPAFGSTPDSLNHKLERVQRRCHRIICNLERGEKCDCGEFEELTSRRKRAMVKLFCKAVSEDHI